MYRRCNPARFGLGGGGNTTMSTTVLYSLYSQNPCGAVRGGGGRGTHTDGDDATVSCGRPQAVDVTEGDRQQGKANDEHASKAGGARGGGRGHALAALHTDRAHMSEGKRGTSKRLL